MIRKDRHKSIYSCCNNKGNINSNSLEGSVEEWMLAWEEASVEVWEVQGWAWEWAS